MDAHSASFARSVAAPVTSIRIDMKPPGHWHFTRSKQLEFSVTDGSGAPVIGLEPEVTVRTLAGGLERLSASDLGDGTYAASYAAWEIGSDYATSYSVAFAVTYQGDRFAEAWPVEVVRDGREDIFKADGRYLYQVRYGWSPGRPVASADMPVTFSFEPRRVLIEGEALDRRQPWRHPSDHLPGLAATILVCSTDGGIREEIPAAYGGLGVYRAQRTFGPTEVGTGRAYVVSMLFTDPYNGQSIGVGDNAYVLEVRGK